MPEPISCHRLAGSAAVECDPVPIGPEPDTPALRVRGRDPVDVAIALPVAELVRSCGTKALGASLAVANPSTQPATFALSVFRAVVDLEQCVETTLERVALRAQKERAVELCEKNGGEPVGFVLETLTCEVPPDYPLR